MSDGHTDERTGGRRLPAPAGRFAADRRRRTTLRLSVGASVIGIFAAAACGDNVGPGTCFEPNATSYPFSLPADSNFIFRWPGSYVPVRVYAEPAGELVANTQAAMQLWVGAFRCNEFAMQMVTDSTRADIIVRNPPVLPPAVAAFVVAADSVGACRGVTEFDTAQSALDAPMRVYVSPVAFDSAAVAACYRFVTAHEIGHALGLLSHSPDPADLMHTQPRRRLLTAADRYTIQRLYHTTPTIGPPPR
ncbi:MAG: matrixin family metalloprotease [Gemmatimonadetes bacterium]|nr:matrixin family metalloprotease [Gemmatimonadota bacterium]